MTLRGEESAQKLDKDSGWGGHAVVGGLTERTYNTNTPCLRDRRRHRVRRCLMPWTDRIVFLDKARHQLVMMKIVGPPSDSELSSSPYERLPANANNRRHPRDRDFIPSILDHDDDDAMSHDFA